MRQAVVIIHGMGEQKPMSTLRGFVDTLVKYEASEQLKKGEIKKYEKNYWSKPDEMSESFELRRLVLAGKGKRPTTDFFEYYWAFQMRGTTMGHIVPWFKTLLLKWPWKVPRRLRLVWIISWVLTLLILTGAFLFFSGGEGNLFGGGNKEKILTLLGTTLLVWIQKTLIGSIGDAARYLTPAPVNIAERHAIRKNGIELLRKLHEPDENGEHKYDRIILAGHSLGSVIAYDMITHLWSQYNTVYKENKIVKKEFFDEVKKAADQLGKAIKENKPASEIYNLRSVFQQKQLALGQAMREAGNPWLVTDFVTMGCPLAHSAFLLAKNKKDLIERINERELPVCPPVSEKDGKYYYFNLDDKRYYLHHAAPFAPTTWTNIYFPGDIVGGPVSKEMGIGVKDIKVFYNGTFQKFISRFSPLTHIAYWLDKPCLNKMNQYKTRDAIKALYETVNIDRQGMDIVRLD